MGSQAGSPRCVPGSGVVGCTTRSRARGNSTMYAPSTAATTPDPPMTGCADDESMRASATNAA